MSADRETPLVDRAAEAGRRVAGQVGRARQILDQLRRQAEAKRVAELEQAQIAGEKELGEVDAKLQRERAALTESLHALEQGWGLAAAPWEAKGWREFTPSFETPVPHLARIGSWKPWPQGALAVPAMVPLIGGRNLLIEGRGKAKPAAAEAVSALLLRLLGVLAPGKLRFLFIDPVGLGQNVATFLHLRDVQEELTHGKAWTEPQQIEQQLAGISAHMETVIQNYFRGSEQSMEEYNLTAGEIAEPYRVVTVLNFPANFTDTAARRLVSIATNGPRCGVYVVGTIDLDVPPPHGFQLDDLRRTAHVVREQDGKFLWPEAGFDPAVRLELDRPPAAQDFIRIVRAVGEHATSTRVVVPFDRIAIPAADRWTATTIDGLAVPVGWKKANEAQEFRIGQSHDQVHQALIAGRPGAGKSNLLHVLVTSLALKYSPDELELHIVDMKKGVEFKPYADHPLPHIRVLAIGSEREFALSVLEHLDAELDRRGRLFTSNGANDLAAYRRKTGRALPRVLLLVDEFQELFGEDDAIAGRAASLLDKIVRQGRSFGLHLVLASQTLASHARTLPRGVMGLIKLRIAFDSSEADSRIILSDDNPAASRLTRAGEAIYNSAGGLAGKGNETRFQAAFLSSEQREMFGEQITRLASEKKRSDAPATVFEHDRPVKIEACSAMRGVLTVPAWETPPAGPRLWLGEPVAIREEATHLSVLRQPGSNLLVLGRDEGMGASLIASSILSLATQFRPGTAEVFLLRMLTADREWSELPARLAEALPLEVRLVPPRALPETLAKLATTLVRRAETEAAGMPPLFLVIPGLHRARDLQPEEGGAFASRDSAAVPSPNAHFLRLLREGPELGVHVLAWCDTFANFTRVTDRSALRAFDLRVALPMTREDSNALIDDYAASRLDRDRAYVCDLASGRLEKFRPFARPDESWLRQLGDALRKRT